MDLDGPAVAQRPVRRLRSLALALFWGGARPDATGWPGRAQVGGRWRAGADDHDSDSSGDGEEAEAPAPAPRRGLPPSDSETESEGEGGSEAVNRVGRVGELPPNSSDEDGSGSEEESSEEDEPPMPQRGGGGGGGRKQREEAAAMSADMERLRLIRERRAQQAKERIEAEGFDRFAPISDGNRPPIKK